MGSNRIFLLLSVEAFSVQASPPVTPIFLLGALVYLVRSSTINISTFEGMRPPLELDLQLCQHQILQESQRQSATVYHTVVTHLL